MKKKFFFLWAIGVSVGLCLLLTIVFYQKKQIDNMRMSIKILDETKISHSDCYAGYKDETYNYLAIGNSITMHISCSYWWNQCGMAASTPDKDYYHLVQNYLEDKYGEISPSICNLATWEMMDADRDEAVELLVPYLSEKLNLITVQLGDNVNNLDTFENDYRYLIGYIKEKAPNADIIIVGDFWYKKNRDEIKLKIAKEYGCSFVDLSDIKSNNKYRRQLGDVVFDIDGEEHEVKHKGVAKHPNDDGMKYIANHIIDVIK